MRAFSKNKEMSNTDIAKAIIKTYNLERDQERSVTKQVINVIEELESIDQDIDHNEIIKEVMEQNEVTANKSKSKIIEIKRSGRDIMFTNESMNEVNFVIKYGGLSLDLRNYDWNAGDLTLNLKMTCAGVDIYVNSDVAVNNWLSTSLSGTSYKLNDNTTDSVSKLELEADYKHTLTLEGKVKLSGVQIIYDHVGEVDHSMENGGHERHLENRKKQKLEKLERQYNQKRERIEKKHR